MQEVRTSTRFLLKSFKGKIDELKASAGPDIQKLLRFGVDDKAACLTARKFFGADNVPYVAIDGTWALTSTWTFSSFTWALLATPALCVSMARSSRRPFSHEAVLGGGLRFDTPL